MAPSGWTLLIERQTAVLTTAVWTKLAGGSEPANYTWSFSATTDVSGVIWSFNGATVNGIDSYTVQTNGGDYTREYLSAWLPTGELVSGLVWDGREISNPPLGEMPVGLFGTVTGGTTAITWPGLTPTTSKDYLLAIAGILGNVRATAPSGFTESYDFYSGDASLYVANKQLVSAAATGDATGTMASVTTNNAILVAIRASILGYDGDAGAMSAGATVEADSIVLDYGVAGNGYYEVNAIDGLYAVNSPYWQYG
jgi:hypothetical protein